MLPKREVGVLYVFRFRLTVSRKRRVRRARQREDVIERDGVGAQRRDVEHQDVTLRRETEQRRAHERPLANIKAARDLPGKHL